jgi:ubiquinone/menaquinone biosynthesis C-methylase UbiE
MIEWSRLRAREENVEATVQFNVADVLHLPFKADRFDVVLCESVLAFVADKRQTIVECLRVIKPGGHLGLNETFWKHAPSPELVARMDSQLGTTDIPTAETWQVLREQSGLGSESSNCMISSRAGRSGTGWNGWGGGGRCGALSAWRAST